MLTKETKKRYRIYTRNGSVVELIEDKTAPETKVKGIVDFVNFLRYRDTIKGVYHLYSNNYKKLRKQFFSQYKIVEAAGGIVFNETQEILLIHRRGFWDLPKGKFEKGETKKECALREVEEETNVKGLTIVQSLRLYYNGKKTTYHTYRSKNKATIKPSYWYIMKAKKQELTPQTEEDIEQAIWVKQSDLPNYYDGAYPAIRDILISVKELNI